MSASAHVPPRCRGWQQEAALRMLDNNLDPEVAEKPAELIVYGGIGKAARDHASYAAIRRELMELGDEETLLVQSGKPVAVFETHERAAGADRQHESRAAVGDLGALPGARRGRTHHVRADDGRLLDLHRQPGDPAGHV